MTEDNQSVETWVDAFLDALALAFGRSWLYVCLAKDPDRHVRSAREGVCRLITFVAESAGRVDTKMIKDLTAWWRREAVKDQLAPDKPAPLPCLEECFRGCLSLKGYATNERARILHQLSRAGRAGPGPIKEQVEQAKWQHHLDLTKRVRVSRRDRISLRRFTRIWIHGKTDGLSMSFPQSTSATFECPRKRGGLTSLVRSAVADLLEMRLTYSLATELISVCSDLGYTVIEEGVVQRLSCHISDGAFGPEHGLPIKEYLFPWREEYIWERDVGPQEWEVVLEHLYGYAAMALRCGRFIRSGDLPDASQAVVEERGAKVRVVTPVTACFAYMASALNSVLLRLLDRDPRLRTKTSRGEGGEPLSILEDCGSDMSSLPNLWVRSVDMKRASDLIPHPVARELLEGLIDGLGWSPFLRSVFRVAAGPHLLHEGESVTLTSSGILMGSGITWPLLSLYNLWLWESAWTKEFPKSRKSKVRRRCRVVGDDLLGIAPRAVSDRYTENLVRTGGEPSFGKDLLSTQYGVLVEELIPTRIRAPKPLPTISVRSIQPTARVERSGSLRPAWAMGPALCAIAEKAGWEEWLIRFIHFKYQPEILTLKRYGLNPFLPREFGGGGFPSIDRGVGALNSLRPKWARALRCAMSQGDHGVSLMASLPACWTDRFEGLLSSAEADFWRKAQADSIVEVDQKVGLVEGYPSIGEAANSVVAAVEAAARLVKPSKIVELQLTPKRVRRRIDQALDRLNGLVPYPKMTDSPTDLNVGLQLWLDGRVRRRIHKVSLLPVVATSSVTTAEAAWITEE